MLCTKIDAAEYTCRYSSLFSLSLSLRYGTALNFNQYKEDYITLYVDTIRPLVLELDDSRSYVVSSPSNGIKSENDGYIAQNPGDSLYGDGKE